MLISQQKCQNTYQNNVFEIKFLKWNTLFSVANGLKFLLSSTKHMIWFRSRRWACIVTWFCYHLTHWGRVTHICVGKLTNIGSDNGLSPGRRQAIIWTNAGISLIGPLRTNLNEILIGIQTFSFKKMHLKMSSAKWRPFCLGLNELIAKPGNKTGASSWPEPYSNIVN